MARPVQIPLPDNKLLNFNWHASSQTLGIELWVPSSREAMILEANTVLRADDENVEELERLTTFFIELHRAIRSRVLPTLRAKSD
ncbi:MAG TPA: hypothetical protein VGX03_17990 [Candidatus Binatia bacterium]|jgi:hypothetical protein|nr:hypothetical protein [Candidatus Binatia bacterium]